MTDSNLKEKIMETITNVFKKTKVFEKIGKIEFYISSFFIISYLVGLTSICMNYYNLDKIKKLEDKIKVTDYILKYNIEINRKQYNKLIDQFNNEIENSAKLIDKIKEIQCSKPKMITETTSTTSLLPIKTVLPNENNDWVNQDDDWVNHIIGNKNDDELENECYDYIPMNNLKKNTGLNWLFK